MDEIYKVFLTVLALLGGGAEVQAEPLFCPKLNYYGVNDLFDFQPIIDPYYSGGSGLLRYGDLDLHNRMKANFAELTIDMKRTPLVLGEPENGRLHVFYCAETKCSMQEELGDAPRECSAALGVDRCYHFARKSNRGMYCTWGPLDVPSEYWE